MTNEVVKRAIFGEISRTSDGAISSVTGLSQSNSPEGSASVIATSNCSLEIDTSWRAKRDLAKGAPPSLWEGLRHNELL